MKKLFVLSLLLLLVSCKESEIYLLDGIKEKNYLYSIKTQGNSYSDISGAFFLGIGSVNSSSGFDRKAEFYFIRDKRIEYVCVPMSKVKIELTETDTPYFTVFSNMFASCVWPYV